MIVHSFEAFAGEVLGHEAWSILRKSVTPDLHSIVAPRLVLGWLRQMPEGTMQVPGTEMTVTVANGSSAMIRTAAEICAAFDFQPTLAKTSPAVTGRLGKAIDDLLARRKKVVGLEKVDEPAKVAEPWGPHEPVEPDPQTKQKSPGQTSPMQPPKLTRTEAVTYRQLQQACWRCGLPQIVGAELRGCLCTARLIKSEPVFFGARGPEMVLIGADAIVAEILATLPEN